MTELRQRAPRLHDSAHLAFVRTRPCCACKRPGPSEAAHIRMACPARGKEYTGKGEKPSDMWTTPLCAYCHRTGLLAQHNVGEVEFWKRVGRDPFAIALALWQESGGEERAAMPQPVKRPRKIRARKPPEHRRKVGAGRPLKSNPVIPSRGFAKRPSPGASA